VTIPRLSDHLDRPFVAQTGGHRGGFDDVSERYCPKRGIDVSCRSGCPSRRIYDSPEESLNCGEVDFNDVQCFIAVRLAAG
jgi:hypothetical protein